MPLLILLIALVQVACILHVYRSGRSYLWALVILSLPLLGSVVYYLLEVLPAAFAAQQAPGARAPAPRADPHVRLHARLAALAQCPSVNNKTAAADEYMRCGAYAHAVELYGDALTGPHADDPKVLLGLAHAQVNHGSCETALSTLDRLCTVEPRFRPEEARLLRARAFEGMGDTEKALAEYEEVALVYLGLEAKCRYALLLRRLGFSGHAERVFADLLEHATRMRSNIESERAWIDLARRHVVKVQPEGM
ncbi:MAG: hypothetical protein IT532_01230 [Burkholderiales bacterium]|nr:hypothetical protein [Burkholderiales bacterium]